MTLPQQTVKLPSGATFTICAPSVANGAEFVESSVYNLTKARQKESGVYSGGRVKPKHS